MYYYAAMYQPNELYHYGVKGMRWGVRRYQNADGSLTSAGQRHRAEREGGSYSSVGSKGSSGSSKKAKLKKALKIGLGAAAAAGLVYEGRKLYKSGALDRARLNAHILGAKSKYGLTKAQSRLADKRVDILERGGIKGIAKTKARNASLRARTAYDRARGGVARGKQYYYENGGVSGLASKARRKYTTSGGARGIASGVTGRAKSAAKYYGSKARYGLGYAQGTARRVGNTVGSKARNASLRARTAYDRARGGVARGKQYYYENGGVSGLASKARRKYTTSGGARGIASGVTGRAKSAAKYYGSKARYGLGYAQGTANRTARRVGNEARILGYNASSVFNDARTAYYNRKRKRYS